MIKVNEIIAELDENGCFLYVSETIEEHLGYSQLELIGRNLFYLIHPNDWETAKILFTPDVTPKLSTNQFITKSGSSKSLQWILHIYPNLNGEKRFIFVASPATVAISNSKKYNILALTKPDGAIFYANPDFCDISKFSLEELIGQDHKIVNSKFHTKDYFQTLYASIYTNRIWHGELRNKAKDGTIYWLDTILVPRVDSQNQITHFIGIRTDITQNKLSTQNSLADNTVLTTIFNHTPIMIVNLDTKFNFILVNQAYSDTCKIAIPDFIGKNHFDLYPNEENQRIFQNVVDTGEPFFAKAYPFEFPDQPERGVTFWDWSLVPVKDKEGNVTSLVFSLEEVTKQVLANKIIKEAQKLEIENAKKLAISEERYKGLLNNLEAGVVIHGADTSILLCNERACELLGLSYEQMIGKLSIDPEWRFINEDNTHCSLEDYPVHLILNSRQPIQNKILGINRPRTKDIVWVSVNGFPSFNENGEILEIIISFIDITAKKESESRIRNAYNEVLQRQFAIDQHAIVAITDLAGNITYANEKFCKISKYSKEELLGQNHRIINSGFHSKEFFSELYSTIKRGETWSGEIKNKAKDGTFYWVATTIIPLKNQKGKNEQYISIRTDITPQKNAEEKVLQSEARFHTIFDRAPIGIALIDFQTGKFRQVNPRYCEMLGYKEEELVSKHFQEVTEPNDLPICLQKLNLLIKGQIDILSMEKRYIKKDKTHIWVNLTCVPMKFEREDNFYHIAIVDDITESKQAREQLLGHTENLKMLNATKDKFFNIIAHDLRNPFSGIINLIDLILGENKEVQEIQKDRTLKYLLLMRDSSKSAFNLLENLLQWSRNQTGDIQFYPTTLHFRSLVNQSISLLVGNAMQKHITIETDFIAEDSVFADETLINTVIRNLLSNAIKFTFPYGRIRISTQRSGEFLVTKIEDNGIGIEPEDISKLFRIDSKYTRLGTQKEKGTGLGLILCKEFVEKHGCRIWVESEIGKGSIFYFTLPLLLTTG